jgi:hypothetical protein
MFKSGLSTQKTQELLFGTWFYQQKHTSPTLNLAKTT